MPQQNTTQQFSLLAQVETVTANKTLTEFDTGKEFHISAGSAIVITLPDLASTSAPISTGWNCTVNVLTNFSHSVTASAGSAGARQTVEGVLASGPVQAEYYAAVPVGGLQARTGTDVWIATAIGGKLTFTANGTKWIVSGFANAGKDGSVVVSGFNSLV
jgi:hypothetical protein